MYNKTISLPVTIACLPVLLLLLFASCGNKEKKQAAAGPPPPPRVDAFIVQKGSVTERLEFPGSVIAGESTQIHPEVPGRLTYLNIAEGRRVAQGTLLAKIYDGDLVAQLNKLKIQLKLAEETAERYAELLKINGVSRQEYDLKVLEISNIRADMAIVSSNIRRTEIRAPFSGTLGLKLVSPGAYITPATVITEIKQTDRLKLDFTLPERYTVRVFKGLELHFSVEGNDKVYKARVSAAESGVSEANRSLIVRADVINADNKLLPGAFVRVVPQLAPDTSAIMVPSRAIIPQSRGKKVAIFRNGEVSFSNVETGIRDSAMVQVLSGLAPGDTLITTGLLGLKPGMKAVIRKISNINQ